ncbi:metallophosphoesterase family protein [Rhodopirellula halodulae]|uniref:metallophosphoesterase family protein n=1 Tax=Rhodopirellula halodulae TaxID=2894198 RepID=UPI001E342393|nr:metallophosphoesterase family protein [Rhodopirellula sp. JC737]MCC9656740.1 serine/threonine protein phosphatase [Rhodopirellula sp. JC737]
MTRHLAIGDIHGCIDALRSLVAFVDLRGSDTVVTLGDYVDRGPDTRSVIDWLIAFGQSSSLVALRGNHDVMMLNARINVSDKLKWGQFGGVETLDSYATEDNDIPDLDDIPPTHSDFLARLRPYYETEIHIFVHATVAPNTPMDEQTDWSLYWDRYSERFPGHKSGKFLVCGHKSQDSGLPIGNDSSVCIDTGACKGGWLSCFCTETGEIWQANEQGETRSMHLDDVNVDARS